MLNLLRKFLLINIIIFTQHIYASETDLVIKYNNTFIKQLSKKQLSSRSDLETITVSGNPAFNYNSHTYQAFKLCDFIKSTTSISDISNIEFKAFDGYVSVIPAALICDTKDVAYLAIEPQGKWPPLPHGSGTAGPYDVIWYSQGKDMVDAHYWPWQVVEINLKTKLDARAQLPAPKTNTQNILAGYNTFVRSCSGCHTLNEYGSSHMGPDLNKPKSPVQYFKNDATLKQFIRYPQSIRLYKNDRMPGVANTMSEKELNDLIAFFYYMSKQQ